MLFYSRHDLHLQWKKIKLIDVLLSSRHQHNQTRKEENDTELNLTLGLAFRLSECLCRQLQMQVTITMEQTCDGIGCRIADGRSGLWHESYSPTPPAVMLILLGALDESAVREARCPPSARRDVQARAMAGGPPAGRCLPRWRWPRS